MPLEADIAQCLARHPAVRLGILFGSVKEDRAGHESDLDLAVMGERALYAELIKRQVFDQVDFAS